MKKYRNFFIVFIVLLSACNNNHSDTKKVKTAIHLINKDSSLLIKAKEVKEKRFLNVDKVLLNDSDLTNVTFFTDKFVISMRYATKDNFLDTILYPCAKCLLRFEVVKDLLKAESEFEKDGYRLKIYDCYRPFWVQKLMWKKIPVPGLVANPATGSRHNRGSAVDVSLVDASGNELDFGTPHDDFSKKAKTFYPNLSDTIKKNRLYLREVMQHNNFSGINSEWWHFSHNCGTKYKVSNRGFDCDSL